MRTDWRQLAVVEVPVEGDDFGAGEVRSPDGRPFVPSYALLHLLPDDSGQVLLRGPVAAHVLGRRAQLWSIWAGGPLPDGLAHRLVRHAELAAADLERAAERIRHALDDLPPTGHSA